MFVIGLLTMKHFEEDKTKFILFVSNGKIKSVRKVNMKNMKI